MRILSCAIGLYGWGRDASRTAIALRPMLERRPRCKGGMGFGMGERGVAESMWVTVLVGWARRHWRGCEGGERRPGGAAAGWVRSEDGEEQNS